jgi:hypothetical protein
MRRMRTGMLFCLLASLALTGCAFVNLDLGSFTRMQPFE